MSVRRKRPLVRSAAAPQPPFDVLGLPDDLLRRDVPRTTTCADAREFALTGRAGRFAMRDANAACRRLQELLEQARRDMNDYVDLLFAHVIRMLLDGHFSGIMVRAINLDTGAAFVNVVAAAPSSVVLFAVHRDAPPLVVPTNAGEVREQVNDLVEFVRAAPRRGPYAIQVVSPAFARDQTTSLIRVLREVRAGGANRLVLALRESEIVPADLRRALAQAVLFSRTMNASSTTGAATLPGGAGAADAVIDVRAVEAACGLAPDELAWIDVAARILAMSPQMLHELDVGDVTTLLADLGVAPS